ncbi:MAG TPA: hypothetical protein VE669_09420 [Actinomycetota bacterium]|nr:hypothetical protein [Actinomycetota bacterium]
MAGILVVCTGNVCRSPIAEALVRARLAERLGASAPRVASAGVAGWDGSGADPGSVATGAELGVDLRGHRARGLDPGEVADAAVVIAMSRSHREQLVTLIPDAGGRIFTLKELVRLLEAQPPPVVRGAEDAETDPEDRLRWRVAQADALRRERFDGNPLDEDVADPLGMPIASFRAIAWEMDEWCGRLVDGLFGTTRVSTGTGPMGA